MLELLEKYIIEVNENEFNSYIESGFEVIASSVKLPSIYEELEYYFDNIEKTIYAHFEYFEVSVLLLLDDRYYWLTSFE